MGILNITSSISYSPIPRSENLAVVWEISFNLSYDNFSWDEATISLVLDDEASYNMFNVYVWFYQDSLSYGFKLFDSKNKLLIFVLSITCFCFSFFNIFYLQLSFEDFDKDVIKKWVEGKVCWVRCSSVVIIVNMIRLLYIRFTWLHVSKK